LTRDEAPLIYGFLRSVVDHAERPALVVDDRMYTYRELHSLASSIAGLVSAGLGGERSRPVGLLGQRSFFAYAGVLGILMSGRAYVPLNPRFPAGRLVRIADRAGCGMVIADGNSRGILSGLSSGLPGSVKTASEEDLPADGSPASAHVPAVSPEDTAYIMFTSGSTGTPKGVPVSDRNVTAYVDYVSRRYGVGAEDRLSQVFDLTFDLSVHDMFVSWGNGACLCCVPASAVMAPARFIRDIGLTMWFSVPSSALFMSRMRMLKPSSFPSLRLSLFCGEPLTAVLAEEWQDAAPGSLLENLYGPTEATVAISHYTWRRETSPAQCRNGIVPIGRIFRGQRGILVDGELYLGGPQVTAGYLDDPERTAGQFVRLSGDDTVWYRTGDLVERDGDGLLHFLGRLDSQVKIRGYRVELLEVEEALRSATGSGLCVALAYPVRDSAAEGLVAVVHEDSNASEREIIEHCRRVLPDYMVPARVYRLADFPLNPNGKVDRNRLLAIVDERCHGE
jgi:amino acid adenylation domain-containing protein